MKCYCCSGDCRKSGSYRNKNRVVQRYCCERCGKSSSESQPLDGLRIEQFKAIQIIKLLCEGMGVRGVARIVDCHRDTVLAVLETTGRKCAALLDARVRYVKANFVETDEIYTYVGRRKRWNLDDEELRGEFFTFLSVDAESKLIINWKVDKRTSETTEEFLYDLKARMLDRFQLTTDAFLGYCTRSGGVSAVFNDSQVDYATEKKMFGHVQIAPYRFLTKVKAIKRKPRIGKPNMDFATTCHCERMNLSVRQFTKRFNRATLGYSKTLANLRHAVALFTAHFNYCRVHGTTKQTPAVAAKLTQETWTVEKLIEECGKY